jgi:rubrerythrin
MVITLIFILLAVGILAFAIITQPFYEVSLPETNSNNPVQDELPATIYTQHLNWLYDLDIELAAGKISAQDYQAQKKLLDIEIEKFKEQVSRQEKIVESSNELEIEGLISDRKLERVERSVGFCTQCGMPLQRSDLFCPACGLKLK